LVWLCNTRQETRSILTGIHQLFLIASNIQLLVGRIEPKG